MNKKQIVYVPTKEPKEGENCVLNYPDMDIYLKPTEGYFFTTDEFKQFLKDYTERIVENVKLNTPTNKWQDRYVDNQSIQNQLDKILKELGL